MCTYLVFGKIELLIIVLRHTTSAGLESNLPSYNGSIGSKIKSCLEHNFLVLIVYISNETFERGIFKWFDIKHKECSITVEFNYLTYMCLGQFWIITYSSTWRAVKSKFCKEIWIDMRFNAEFFEKQCFT